MHVYGLMPWTYCLGSDECFYGGVITNGKSPRVAWALVSCFTGRLIGANQDFYSPALLLFATLTNTWVVYDVTVCNMATGPNCPLACLSFDCLIIIPIDRQDYIGCQLMLFSTCQSLVWFYFFWYFKVWYVYIYTHIKVRFFWCGEILQ